MLTGPGELVQCLLEVGALPNFPSSATSTHCFKCFALIGQDCIALDLAATGKC